MQAYDKAVADPMIRKPSQHIKSLKLPGFYRCCVYRWQKTRISEKWTLLCKSSPKVAKACKELPSFLRAILGKKQKFSQRAPSGSRSESSQDTTTMLPPELATAISDSVVSWMQDNTYMNICIYIYIYMFLILIYSYICFFYKWLVVYLYI